MSPQYSDSRSSKIIEIVAQSGDKSYFVHRKVLLAQSEQIRRTITTQEKIELLDWDGNTVGRFVEFLYDGGYHVFTISEGPDGENIPEREGIMMPDKVQGLGDQEDVGIGYENVLLAHAKVYALAQCKGVEGLKKVAMRRLRIVLEEVGWRMLWGYPKGVVDVIELLGYVHCHTLAKSEEPIRELVSTFASENLERLMGQKEMELLLAKEGGLAIELMEGVATRLCTAGRKALYLEREVKSWKKKVSKSDKKLRQADTENEEKLRKLEAISTERLNKALELEGKIADMKRSLKDGGPINLPLQGPAYKRAYVRTTFPPRMLFYIAVASVIIIVATLFIQNAPQTADRELFRGLCQYYKAHSLAGNTIIDTLGGKLLKEKCRQSTPGLHLTSLLNSGQQGICQFFEARGWAGTDIIDTSIVGGSLRRSCQDLGYTSF